MVSRAKSSGTKRTKVQEAVIELRKSRNLTQMSLAVHMGITTTTVGRWESIRPPRSHSLAALAQVAHEFSRDDLAAIFEREFEREFSMLSSGLGGAVRHLGIVMSAPLEWAVAELHECAQADQTRQSVSYREYRKVLKRIVTANALLIQEVAKGKVVKLGHADYLKSLEHIQIQLEEMEQREEYNAKETRK